MNRKKSETYSATPDSNLFLEVFATITEPRRVTRGNFKHQLQDILLLVFSAVLCGANDWNEIEDFGWESTRMA